MALIDDLRLAFPWLDDIGLSPAWFQETAATSASSAEIVQNIRNTPQYKGRFPGLFRQDGSIRMSEAEYIQQENNYRQLLRQHGFDQDEYRTPATLAGFFDAEVDPNELRDRLDVYRQVQQGGQRIKDAFYVYAGMDISDDDLFEAIVDPAAEQNLSTAYNQAVAGGSLDYGKWITRATDVGLRNVANELQRLQKAGAITGQAVQRILNVDAGFARQMMDSIYTGGQQGGMAGSLSLQELLDSFEFAAIGAAAQNAGLELPTRERLAEIRAAGVDRAKAIGAYTEFGRNANAYSGAVQRARGTAFGQAEFEAGQFLGEAEAGRAFEAGLNYREAAGRSQGSFRFDEQAGRFVQRGFTDVAA